MILRDLEVLRAPVGGGVGSAKVTSRGPDSFSAILKVTDTQVQKLYWAMKNGDWHLQLRPPVKAADSPENVESSIALLREGVRDGELQTVFGGDPR